MNHCNCYCYISECRCTCVACMCCALLAGSADRAVEGLRETC